MQRALKIKQHENQITQLKWTKDLYRHLTMEAIQMANKYTKRFSISFVEIKPCYIKKHVILDLVNGLSAKGSEIFTGHMST